MRKKSKKVKGTNGTHAEISKPSGLFGLRISTFMWVILAVAVLFLIFLAIVFTQPTPKTVSSTYKEPLIPIVGLRLQPGEKYVYKIWDREMTIGIENLVRGRADGCMEVDTVIQNMSISFCLDEKTGEAKLVGPYKGDESSGSAGPEFAQPWMLALKDGWSWRIGINTTVIMLNANETLEVVSTYHVAARGNIKGRDAFKVIVETMIRRISNGKPYESANRTEIVWIDSEKRVLLYSDSNGIKTELVQAPFKIEPYSGDD